MRERGNDVILLAEHFLHRFNMKYKKEISTITLDAKKLMLSYNWPGNVRELENVIERAVILSSRKALQADDLHISNTRRVTNVKNEILNLEELEYRTIEKALILSGGNMNGAAELLGISRFALYRKINKNGKTEN